MLHFDIDGYHTSFAPLRDVHEVLYLQICHAARHIAERISVLGPNYIRSDLRYAVRADDTVDFLSKVRSHGDIAVVVWVRR